MLPLKYQCLKPYLEPRTRIIALTTDEDFGGLNFDDEHLVRRLDKFVGNIENEKPHQIYQNIKGIDYVSRISGLDKPSDVLLKDINRQNKTLMERFYPYRPDLHDIKMITDFATRNHIAISRGYERHLINHFNRLDAEWLNRQSLEL